MSFFDEINSILGGEEVLSSFKATIFGKSGVYFENVKDIKSFEKEKVELRLKKGEITVWGEELCIKKYCSGDVAVTGKIKGVSIT